MKVDSIYAIIEERRIGMEKPKFISYTRPNGHNEFEEFYNSLPTKDRNKLRATIDMIEEAGIQAAIQLEWVKNWILKYTRYDQKYLRIFKELYIFMLEIINILLHMDLLRKPQKHQQKK